MQDFKRLTSSRSGASKDYQSTPFGSTCEAALVFRVRAAEITARYRSVPIASRLDEPVMTEVYRQAFSLKGSPGNSFCVRRFLDSVGEGEIVALFFI
jgi:hypothetical protein